MSELLRKQVDGVMKMKIPVFTHAHEKVAKKKKIPNDAPTQMIF